MSIDVRDGGLDGVVVIEPTVYQDERGTFSEVFREDLYADLLGNVSFWPQDNLSTSTRGVLRGLHYQVTVPQAKLVMCTRGEIFDVAVDLRRSSPNFMRWTSNLLSGANRHQVWVPAGFAHGFYVMSESADVLYKVSAKHDPVGYRRVAWNDPELAIAWPLTGEPIVSDADLAAPSVANADTFA